MQRRLINDADRDALVVKIFTQKILDLRQELKVTPRKCQPVSLNEAAQLCNVGTIGATVTDLITLQEQGDKRDMQDFLDKHMPHLIAAGMIIAFMVVGYMIIMRGGS